MMDEKHIELPKCYICGNTNANEKVLMDGITRFVHSNCLKRYNEINGFTERPKKVLKLIVRYLIERPLESIKVSSAITFWLCVVGIGLNLLLGYVVIDSATALLIIYVCAVLYITVILKEKSIAKKSKN